MARRNGDGKFILSAGEVGGYTVCPEAWRLRQIAKVVPSQIQEKVEAGRRLHDEWSKKGEQAFLLARAARIILLMVLLSLIAYMYAP